ncbi:hypothetical protein [Ruegeria sp. SCP11]|uniref:hypothetical protein n=1 Tax=Ruegeria sp. SCP11 TaxID=3141378 RepID=UPI00333B8B67
METPNLPAIRALRPAWNKGRIVGQKRPLKPKHVWAIRVRLELAGNHRDLALFNMAIDSKLRGCDLVKMKVVDVISSGQIKERASVLQSKTQKPVRFEISEDTRASIQKWTVPCEHTKYPYDRGAFENRRRDGLATLENGLPAWPVAEENGIAFQTFRQRLKRGWSGERAATEGVREMAHDPDDEWEVIALENGLSVRAYRSRVQAGFPEAIAATMRLSWRQW